MSRASSKAPEPVKRRILGHRALRETLWREATRNTLHHALLFEGPKGVGKRLVANELALVSNCERPDPEARPCRVCPTCRSIEAGTHPDIVVLEPDTEKASRTIAIEAVREVIRTAQFHRYGARRRFIVIDPADAMAEPAANALLKTLEEPPQETGFILITHNVRGLLPTIRSRCQRIRFGAVPSPEILEWLAPKAAEQGLEPAQAEAAARLSLGCPGRALHLLEGGLEARLTLRDQLITVLGAPLSDVYAFSVALTEGGRVDWADDAEELIQILEDLLRDAAIRASGSNIPLLDEGAGEIIARLAATWPRGIENIGRAIGTARADLRLYVSGKTVIDALITAVQREMGALS